jgi:hypothetical protein
VLLGAALCAFVRAKAYKTFPAFGAFLIFRLGTDLALDLVLQSAKLAVLQPHPAYVIYYYSFWISYVVGAVIVFLVIQEIFVHLMKPLPGLGRLGLVAFRWVTLMSVLVAVALSILPGGTMKWTLVVSATSGVMRCMSVLELCLLAFVVIAMQTFHLSPRSRDFGVALGLALIASAELFSSAFAFGHSTMATAANYSGQIASVLAACIWATYFFLAPDPETKPVALPVSSQLLRWNQVASALGHPPPQIALGAYSTHFFLQDVEKAVDKVLENNPVNPAG